jgi:hypothetical protein
MTGRRRTQPNKGGRGAAGTTANPGINRLSAHPERRFRVPSPLVAVRQGILRMNSRWDGRYICVLGHRRCRRVKVIWEMSVKTFLPTILVLGPVNRVLNPVQRAH